MDILAVAIGISLVVNMLLLDNTMKRVNKLEKILKAHNIRLGPWHKE